MEIKFRGIIEETHKRYYGENGWFYGNIEILKQGGVYGQSRLTYSITEINPSFRCSNIIPKTLGQFTGKRDKNKKDIYKDDIISYLWNASCTITQPNWIKQTLIINDFIEDTHKLNKLMQSSSAKDFEVIGNIYENTDLL